MTSQTESPETYEKALAYWPYKKSLAIVQNIVCEDAPQNGRVLDLMCGTGYLSRWISEERPDLYLHGVDLDKRYVAHARENNSNWVPSGKLRIPKTRYEQGDILTWQPNPRGQFDAVLCTGALHHIPYGRQEEVVEKIADLTKPEGFAIISDAYIDEYDGRMQRRLAAARLGDAYLEEAIRNRAPEEVIEATLDIMANDVILREFKTSLKRRLPCLKRNFKSVKTLKTWPNKSQGGYGDYIHILRR